jgi:hypothetical protein
MSFENPHVMPIFNRLPESELVGTIDPGHMSDKDHILQFIPLTSTLFLCGVIIESTKVLSLEMVADAVPLTNVREANRADRTWQCTELRLHDRTKLEGETWQ